MTEQNIITDQEEYSKQVIDETQKTLDINISERDLLVLAYLHDSYLIDFPNRPKGWRAQVGIFIALHHQEGLEKLVDIIGSTESLRKQGLVKSEFYLPVNNFTRPSVKISILGMGIYSRLVEDKS